MGMVISVSVLFDTGGTYSCYSNMGHFVELEEKAFSRNIKGVAKGLNIPVFGIFVYSVGNESGHMIAFQDQAYYVPGLSKDLRIISPQVLCTSEV